jgi:uncharacterized delta-60 repeat protein
VQPLFRARGYGLVRWWRKGRSGPVSHPVALGLAVALALLAPLARPATADPGTIDASFGAGAGSLRTNLGGTYDWAYATAVQRDGRILAAGVSNAAGTYDFALARYTSTQDLDPTFGQGGVVLTDFGKSYDWAYALTIQPDGKILVAGVSDVNGGKDFALARFHPNGTPDLDFGRRGRVAQPMRTLTADFIRGIAVQPDGKIVAGGLSFEDVVTVGPNSDFLVARYLPDGSSDLSFGIGGLMATDFGSGSFDQAYALALQPDGRVVLGGYTNDGGGLDSDGGGPSVLFGADQLALARYNPNGLLDPTFGKGGTLVLDGGSLDERILALAVAPGGDLVVGGYVNGEKRSDLLLARLRPDGTPAAGFGAKGNGLSVHDLGTHSERLSSLVVRPDGRIVAGGQTAVANHADFAVFRFDAAGFLDRSFGRAGVASFDFNGREDRVHSIAVQRDGKIVAVGQSEADFAVVRFHAD